MSSGTASDNRFLTAPIGRLFLSNALPMIVLMSMGGLLNLADAAFLGHFVGPQALAAVSICFPLVMLTLALSTLVSGGMASLLARHLGAGERRAAGVVFARAHGLALCLSLCLFLAFGAGGAGILRLITADDGETARMAHQYMLILVIGTPLQFWLGVQADALRTEGRAGLMALMSAGVTLANLGLNYLLIVALDLGVAGSALGTLLAQALGLGLLIGLRLRDRRLLALSVLAPRHWPRRGGKLWRDGWRPMILLGLPLCLSFIGMALVSAMVIVTLKRTLPAGYADAIAAYGIVTRILGLTFMPIMAIALATQSIAGHNLGGRLYPRSDAALRWALVASFLYCLACEGLLAGAAARVGPGFVADPAVAAQVALILRHMLLLYLFTGPVLVLALYFQAIGQPGRAALLTLTKPFVLSPLLIVLCAGFRGGAGLWSAFPLADAVMVIIAARLILRIRAGRRGQAGFGLAAAG
ncbi:MATE family efflux transporter [Phaeovulum sp. W22_SRMD_FR3]|uniref:MATE family efflux transporter n=1 Tax=Phaeovulum sp. W22_SRMD_FR3 TaxID=3240274 RepID=UPI003F9A5F88